MRTTAHLLVIGCSKTINNLLEGLMPKRSNDFQSLIKFIYDRITPETGTVTESAMVYDKDAKILREVDILIEQKLSAHDIKSL